MVANTPVQQLDTCDAPSSGSRRGQVVIWMNLAGSTRNNAAFPGAGQQPASADATSLGDGSHKRRGGVRVAARFSPCKRKQHGFAWQAHRPETLSPGSGEHFMEAAGWQEERRTGNQPHNCAQPLRGNMSHSGPYVENVCQSICSPRCLWRLQRS